MAAVRASIVVVTSDRLVDLRRCLREVTVHLATHDLRDVDVLTVHPPHDTAAMAMVRTEFPHVQVHEARRRHLSEQRNLGVQRARGDVLVFLDDDAWPHARWLPELLAAFTAPCVHAASGPVFRGDGSHQCERLAASPIGRLVPLGPQTPLPAGMSPSFSGCNLAIRRSTLLALGGFDENLPYQPDDMDVCCRLFAHCGRDAGAMRYQPGAAVTHESSPGPYRRTLEDRAWYVVARDNLYFACRHAGSLRGVLGGSLLQLPKLVRFGRWLLQGKLGPLAFLRCVGKHTAGTFAGIWKGLTQTARLPLSPAGDDVASTNAHVAGPSVATTSEAACRTPEPV